MENTITNNIKKVKDDLIAELDKRIVDKIIEKTNADLLKKLIEQAETINEAIMIAELGTTYKRTGFHFDKRLEKMTDTIKYFKKNEKLSFVQDKNALTHKLIIGDNYDALLNLLIEYRGQIDVIYIDPPYGKDSMGEFAKTNYDNAITRDNLLSMLYPRLVLARQLLSDNGVIFCSIDDKNQAYVKGLFDEVFEESNFVGNIVWLKGNAQNDAQDIEKNHEYILSYSNKEAVLGRSKVVKKNIIKENDKYWYKGAGITTGGAGGTLNKRPNLGYTIYFNSKTGEKIAVDDYDHELAKTSNDEKIIYKNDEKLIKQGYIAIRPPKKGAGLGRWTWALDKFNKQKNEIFIDTKSFSVSKKMFVDKSKVYEEGGLLYCDILQDNLPLKSFLDFSSSTGTTELNAILNGKFFDNPKPTELLKYFIEATQNDEVIVLDFFAGSGTTGQAVLELNKQDGGKRRFILATANEITDTTPNGIMNDVTSKRLKRVMTGECYDGTKDFKWNEKNKPLGDNLAVYDIATVANFEATKDKTPFDVIDETLYGKEKFGVNEKIKWVCENFEGTQKKLEDK
jgi:adenine-specific DNA-methyltransferase